MGNAERRQDHDARLFALAVLVSTLLVFNSRGVINGPALQALGTAASLAQHVHQQQEDQPAGGRLGPSFLWVLRDFALALEDATGQPITAREYLEQMLGGLAAGPSQPVEAGAPASDLMEARQRILELFPQCDCAALVRPVEDEEQLQKLAELPRSALRPKFVQQVEELRRKVFDACLPLRSPSGELATGSSFLSLLQAYLDVFNQGSVPLLGPAWQQVAAQECGRAVEEALRIFSVATLDIATALPMSDEEMEEALHAGTEAAGQRFAEVAMGGPGLEAEFRADLRRAFEEGAARVRKENESVATRRNEAFLRREFDSLVEALLKRHRPRHEAGAMSLKECGEAEAQFESAFAQLRTAYDLQAVGPAGAARDGPYREIAVRRGMAAGREVASWRAACASAAAATAASQDTGRPAQGRAAAPAGAAEGATERLGTQATEDRCAEERQRIVEAGSQLTREILREAEASKARAAAKQEVIGTAAVQLRQAEAAKARAAAKREAPEALAGLAAGGDQKACCVAQ